MRHFIIALVLLFYTQIPALAQGWQAEWAMLEEPLDSICAGTGHPLADGTLVNIYHDVDSDGPDETDPPLTVCDDPPNCTCGPAGTANHNTFVVNGGDAALDMPGGFLSGWAPNSGYITISRALPSPNQVYLRACFGNRRYTSIVYTFLAGSINDINMALADWTCEIVPCIDCFPLPPFPTNFSATDSTSCRIIVLNWDYPDSATIPGAPVDSVFIYRNGCRIDGVRSSVIFYIDTTISQVVSPPFVFNYHVRARRNCGGGLYAYAASVTDRGSVYPLPRRPANISASDTICNLVRVSWTYSGSLPDSFFIKRNGIHVQAVDWSVNYFDHYTSDTTRAAYIVVGWSGRCQDEGTPSEVDSGQALACIPITERTPNPLPAAYRLYPNFPNPFNPSTQISFDIPRAADVSLAVFNVTGQKVATLVNGLTEAGNHTVRFDGSGFPSGVYFVRMDAGTWTSSQKMLLLK